MRILESIEPLFQIIGQVLGRQLTLRIWHLLAIILILVVGLKPFTSSAPGEPVAVDVHGSTIAETDSFEILIDDYYHDIDSAEVARLEAVRNVDRIRADSLQHVVDSLFTAPSRRQLAAMSGRATTQRSRDPDRTPGQAGHSGSDRR